ncbi:LysR family transcriptional regulator [Aestuariivirga sp. YIM B02566]|uniref:LysR family transcriptional regulator n=1 Tax=Taklimakanibacter albus TaxID=2800327 RepID=A0ACC5R3U3_9HYPH|nr:LysR substrate-binding domain-containing protein [Aestuariivirga sp. YIM B02566]MBK1867156.1 LysR family transcriptional regulator [Aestuariivirga sp. YIM B02566]
MARNLDIDLVRTFIAVADHASMTAAGNARFLTQGAVSQQIKRLEDMLGHQLIERSRRGLKLTRAGEQLLSKSRRLIALNDDIWSEMTTGEITGTVRLGLPYDLVTTCITPVMKDFAAAHPQVEITLTCAASPELVGALAKGELDLALAEEPVGASRGETLRIERLVWVGARNGGAHLKTPLPVSMVADTCAFRPAVLAALAQQDRKWRTVFENGNIEATAATVRADLAVTAWLVSTVPADLEILGPDKAPCDLPPFAINLHLPKHAMMAPAAELARHLRQSFV